MPALVFRRLRAEALPFWIEVRGPGGDLLHREALYEFLQRLYAPMYTPDEFRFEELEIRLDGQPLLPVPKGNA